MLWYTFEGGWENVQNFDFAKVEFIMREALQA